MQTVERVVGDRPALGESSTSFIAVGQAAKALGVSPMTVRRLYDARKLPGYRQGRSRQILSAFVEGFVAEIKAGRQPVLQEYAATWFEEASRRPEYAGQSL